MSDNYIVINGKKAELTEEQVKQLGINIDPKRSNPFDKGRRGARYWYIDVNDDIDFDNDCSDDIDCRLYNTTNYFNDKHLANQVMLHQQLYRKLLKYAYDNNSEVIEKYWAQDKPKHFIYYNHMTNKLDVQSNQFNQPFGGVYFKSSTVAEQAIKDVVKPFIKENSEFIW